MALVVEPEVETKIESEKDNLVPGAAVDEMKISLKHFEIEFTEADKEMTIAVKDLRTKRLFKEWFTVEDLEQKKMTQPIAQIIGMMRGAIAGKAKNLKFSMGYFPAKSDQFSVRAMKKDFTGGDCIYVVINILESWFAAEYQFKLIEQERDDVDILEDQIADLRHALELCEYTRVAAFKSNVSATSPIQLNQTIGAGLEGMIRGLEDTNASIVIGMDGVYRIDFELSFNTASCDGADIFKMLRNGTEVATRIKANYGPVKMTEIIELKAGDKIQFTCACCHAWTQEYTSIIVEMITPPKLLPY